MSTYPAVTARIVTLITAAMVTAGENVYVSAAWNPEVTADSVFVGRPIWDPSETDLTRIAFEYPAVEVNVPKFETYPVTISAWTFQPNLTPATAQTAINRVFALKTIVDSVFADVDLDIAKVTATPDGATVEKRAFERGWACGVTSDITIRALLTT